MIIIYRFIGFLLLLISTFVLADDKVTAEQDEIDRTVWKTFHDAFEQLDGEALNSVYANSVLRATPAGIDRDDQFKEFNRTRFDENIANGDRIELDFWFDSRRTNMTTSYEVGFYRVSISSSSKPTTIIYGQFHIVLRKINDKWKIVQDWDTDSIGGRSITSEDFNRGWQ